MSYEGYYIHFCEEGHESVRDAYEDDPEHCRQCGGEFVASFSVDETNGPDEHGFCPGERELIAYREHLHGADKKRELEDLRMEIALECSRLKAAIRDIGHAAGLNTEDVPLILCTVRELRDAQ